MSRPSALGGTTGRRCGLSDRRAPDEPAGPGWPALFLRTSVSSRQPLRCAAPLANWNAGATGRSAEDPGSGDDPARCGRDLVHRFSVGTSPRVPRGADNRDWNAVALHCKAGASSRSPPSPRPARNHSGLGHASRNLPSKLSPTPFCQGLPGSINAVPMPCPTIPFKGARATNCGLLSERRCGGAINRASSSITREQRMRPPASMASSSLVHSSLRVRHRSCRPQVTAR